MVRRSKWVQPLYLNFRLSDFLFRDWQCREPMRPPFRTSTGLHFGQPCCASLRQVSAAARLVTTVPVCRVLFDQSALAPSIRQICLGLTHRAFFARGMVSARGSCSSCAMRAWPLLADVYLNLCYCSQVASSKENSLLALSTWSCFTYNTADHPEDWRN